MSSFVIFIVVMIVVTLISRAKQRANQNGPRSAARMQALAERFQPQPGGAQPQGSQQAAAMLQQVMQGGRQAPRPGELAPPGQPQYLADPFAQGQYNAMPYQPGPYNPAPYQPGPYDPAQYQPGPYQPPAHQPPQHNLPMPNQDVDAQVRAMMESGNEVGAIRLLSDERDMGILEAQKYARDLIAPQASQQQPDAPADSGDADDAEEERYVGSAAFAESIFNLDDREENVWASGWVDTPDPDDRSDIDELWQTVSNPPRPAPPTQQ